METNFHMEAARYQNEQDARAEGPAGEEAATSKKKKRKRRRTRRRRRGSGRIGSNRREAGELEEGESKARWDSRCFVTA